MKKNGQDPAPFYGRPWFFPGVTSFLFVGAISLGVVAAALGPEQGWMPLTAKTLLAFGFLFIGAWFLYAFTACDADNVDRKAEAERRASMFRFAYLFSLFSFALLVLPFIAMLRTPGTAPDAGPIRLLRACVVHPDPPASGLVGPVVFCPSERGADGQAAGAQRTSGPVLYPWLVAVGGVVAQECGANNTQCAADARAASASSQEQSRPMFSVSGGFVVPFYVVVFAFVGGIVNLTRRLPEYQKRSACDYVGTPDEPKLMTFEAREFVVFQLMQLLSAPFVAMVAYYALEPESMASTVALAFISGFATESVLLLIRGVVNGLRPPPTKTVAAAATPASLHVTVQQNGAVVKDANVELKRLLTGTPALRSAATDASGAVEFQGLPAEAVWVVATSPGDPRHVLASQQVDLKAGQTESVELKLD